MLTFVCDMNQIINEMTYNIICSLSIKKCYHMNIN
eukprot:UN02730